MTSPNFLPPHESDFPYTVSEVNDTIGNIVESAASLIWLEGEIADFKQAGSGHCYLKIRDNESQIPAVIWKTTAYKQDLSKLELGTQVSIFASVKVYRRGGYYQLDIKRIQPVGLSDMQISFEMLKKQLQNEGIFDEDHKSPLPETVSTLGVVTAKSGAALWDIVNVLNKRAPGTDILLASTTVQGNNAPKEIATAINNLNINNSVDCIIVGRGGGSSDDLSAFNNELVVRAIYNSKIPIISAVGHEVDITLADLVADMRAPTPSAAAEIALSDNNETIRYYNEIKRQFGQLFSYRINNFRIRFNNLKNSPALKKPLIMMQDAQQRVEFSREKSRRLIITKFQIASKQQKSLALRLDALSPLAVLSRGYSVVTDSNSITIKDSSSIAKNDNLNIRFSKGSASVTVDSTTN